ncbi:MAG: M23 family metallopeptidase [Longimicrobiaceae bacterium]
MPSKRLPRWVRTRPLSGRKAAWAGTLVVAGGLALGLGAPGAVLHGRTPPPLELSPVEALSLSTDTFYLGGYARGTFRDALGSLAGTVPRAELDMVGAHLDKIFASLLGAGGLARGGRLRLAYERSVLPNGSARSVRVLAAEAAVGGRLHHAFLFDRDDRPGYYDLHGRPLDGGSWLRPLARTVISSPFGRRRLHPILERMLPHAGVDYAARAGTPVRAAADGVVVAAGRRGGYGKMVEIRHPNGYATRYAHLSEFGEGISEGVLVSGAEVIGYVGSSGLATGAHLHYEIRKGGRPVDPVAAMEEPGPGGGVGYQPTWRREQHALSSVLSRAPTVVARRY